MDFTTALLIWVVSLLITEALTPKPNLKAAVHEQVDIPGIEQDRPVAVLFGSGKLTPQLVWWGDVAAQDVRKRVQISLFKRGWITLATRYALGAVWSICHGKLNRIWEIDVGDRAAFPEAIFGATNGIGEHYMGIGTDVNEAGLIDPDQWLAMFHGYDGDPAGTDLVKDDAYLAARGLQYPVVPKGIAALVMRGPSSATAGSYGGGWIGTSARVRPIYIFASRYCDTQLGAAHGNIVPEDENPANIVYEVMTNAVWGCALPAAKIDTASFAAAAATFDGEGMLLSAIWDRATPAWEFLQEVLRHADAVLFQDPTSGKFKLKPIRNDYTIGSLQILNETNVIDLQEYSRPAWDETRNEVKVNFNKRVNSSQLWYTTIPPTTGNFYTIQEGTTVVHDLGNRQIQGATLSASLSYPFVSNETLALKLAQRDLRALSYPLAHLKVRVNRKAFALNPGDPFVFAWAPLGISQIVMRVTKVNHGAVSDPYIEIEAVQDVFKIGASSYDTTGTGWTDPNPPPQPPTVYLMEEMPWLLALSQNGRFHVMVRQQQPTDQGYYLFYKKSTDTVWQYISTSGLLQAIGMTPSGTLSNDYSRATAYTDDSLTLKLGSLTNATLLGNASADQIRNEGENLALFQTGEIVGYESLTDNLDGTITLRNVHRGLLDTVPQNHAAGERVWFFSTAAAEIPDAFATGEVVQAQPVLYGIGGVLNQLVSPLLSATVQDRGLRPLPPGDARTNSVSFSTAIAGELTVSWKHRDRLLQSAIIDQGDADVGPEAGTTYTLRIYGQSGSLVHTESGLTGTSYTYPLATEIAEAGLGGLPNDHMKIQLEAVRDGRVSYRYQEREFDCAGYGMRYGEYYGGAD